MQRVIKFIIFVFVVWCLSAPQLQANDRYDVRSVQVRNALDSAEMTHSRTSAAAQSRKIAVKKELDEMPFKPTIKPTRDIAPEYSDSKSSDQMLVKEIQPSTGQKMPVALEVAQVVEPAPVLVKEEALSEDLTTESVKEDAVSKELALVSAEKAVSLEKPAAEKDKDSLKYRYFDLENPQNELEMGTEAFDYSYREEGLMKVDGMMYGVYMDYQHRFNENPPVASWADIMQTGGKINILKVDTRLAGGNDLKYRSEGTGEHDGENHYAFETRVMGGYEFPVPRYKLLLTPYVGIGYRYLLDDNGGELTTTGHWGYDRESNYYYIPLGVEAHQFYQGGWKTRLTLEYDLFLSGRQYSHFEDDPNGIYKETIENEQNKGYGLRGAFKVAREGERFEFFMEPFVRYWHIDESDVGWTPETDGIEPNNRTQEYGARLGMRF